MPSSSTLNRRMVIVFVLLFVLGAQGAAAMVGRLTKGEPFPAVIMPGFAKTSDGSGVAEGTRLRLSVSFSDGSRKAVSPFQLLQDVRVSARGPVAEKLYTTLAAGQQLDPATVRWLRSAAQELKPGVEPRSLIFCRNVIMTRVHERTIEPVGPCARERVDLQ